MFNNANLIKETIQAEAYNLGFCLVGFTAPHLIHPSGHFKSWIANGYHAGMSYLAQENNIHARYHPEEYFPGAKTIISLAAQFPNPASLAPETLPETKGRIASYAASLDYHEIIPQKHLQLMEIIQQNFNLSIHWKSAVDANPLPEREIAVAAGMGWIAKNGMLTTLQHGSALFLSEIFLDMDLPLDDGFETEHCGTCTRCLDACPTRCILPDRTLDANQCLSYLTIEHRGEIPKQFHESLGDRIFGCDTCVAVCPWNRKTQTAPRMEEFFASEESTDFDIEQNLEQITTHFGSFFKHSAIRRAGKRGFLRNCLIRLSNTQNPRARHLMQRIIEAVPETRSVTENI